MLIRSNNNPMYDPTIKSYHDTKMRTEEVRTKISDSMRKYREENSFSAEHRRRLSENAKNQKFIHKGTSLKHVPEDKV